MSQSNPFSITIAANSFDWTAPAVGAVSNISTNTIDDVDSPFAINVYPGVTTAGAGVNRLYRDSGIAYSPTLGPSGSVVVSAGGHNDSANNGTYIFDIKTATWSEWKAPTDVYRNAGAYDGESETGTQLLSVNSGNSLASDGRPGVPASVHTWGHSLIIPAGVIPGTSGECLWRTQVGMGWTTSSSATYPFYYHDLSNAANPWVHLPGVSRQNLTYLAGSIYYDGAVYYFGRSNYAVKIDLATLTGSTWSCPNADTDGCFFQITDSGTPYFMFVSGRYSQDSGTGSGPRVRLMNALTKELTTVTLAGDAFPQAFADDFYYSACWSEDKRAIYLTRWVSDDGRIGTDSVVGVDTHTTTKVYKISAPTSGPITGTWTVSTQTVAPYYIPNTGSQMRPRSFWINGCVVNFASAPGVVQAIGVI